MQWMFKYICKLLL